MKRPKMSYNGYGGGVKNFWNISGFLFISIWIYHANSGVVQWMDNGHLLSEALNLELFPKIASALTHPSFNVVSYFFSLFFSNSLLPYLNFIFFPIVTLLNYLVLKKLNPQGSLNFLWACSASLVPCVFWTYTKYEVYIVNLAFNLLAIMLYFKTEQFKSHKLSLVSLSFGFIAMFAFWSHQISAFVLLPFAISFLINNTKYSAYFALGAFLGNFLLLKIFLESNSFSEFFFSLRTFISGASSGSVGYETKFFNLSALQDFGALGVLALSLVGIQLAGFFPVKRNSYERVFLCSIVLNLVFACSYDVSDRFSFFVTGANLLVLLTPCVIERMQSQRIKNVLFALFFLQPLAILFCISLAINLHFVPKINSLPFRNDFTYFGLPYLKDVSALKFTKYLQKNVAKNCTIVGDWTPLGAVRSGLAFNKLSPRKYVSCKTYLKDDKKCFYLIRKKYSCKDLEIKQKLSHFKDFGFYL